MASIVKPKPLPAGNITLDMGRYVVRGVVHEKWLWIAYTPKSEERMLEVFAQVESRLADGRKYLTGDTFTAADLTFAALASPALMPPMYLEKSGVDQAVPPALTQVVERFRETKAGAFAMRMYETERETS